MAFDFHYYSLNFISKKEMPSLPGGLAASAPRLANRLRKDDLLALLITLQGEGVNEKEVSQITQQLTQVFFQTMGSVTRAMNAVAMEINRLLLEYNLNSAHEGRQVQGILNLGVLHKGVLFICHAGPTKSFVLHSDTVDIFGDEVISKPMGTNRNVQVQYYQTNIQPGNLILFSAVPPQSWTTANLVDSSYLNMDLIRRRLLNQTGPDLQAAVFKILPGNEQIHFGRWGEQLILPQQESEKKQAIVGVYSSPLDELQQRSIGETTEKNNEAQIPMTPSVPNVPDEQTKESIAESVQPTGIEEDVVDVHTGQTEQAQPRAKQTPVKPTLRRSGLMQILVQAWQSGEGFTNKVKNVVGGLVHRVIPQSTGWHVISPAFMVFLVIAFPLALIALSLTIYTRNGKDEQFRSYLDLTQQYATMAAMQSDPIQQHEYWRKVSETGAKAAEYGSNSQLTNLTQQAEKTLDLMDLTQRIDFRPALTDLLPQGVSISKVLPLGTDVYLLDAFSGSVLRMQYNSKGYYEIDTSFKCAPGPSGLNTIGPLIDFISLPANQPYNYKVLAVDADGNLLYCLPGDIPSSQRLPAPTGGWSKIMGIALDQSILYVLDSGNDAVWFYQGSGINFSASPAPYFDTNVPKLDDAIDLVVDQEDMFILHSDGHMTTCQYSAYKQAKETACIDPSPYSDNRLGREKHPWLYLDANFVGMQATHLTESSIFILDDTGRTVYQFSYQLNLENTLKVKPNAAYPMPASAPTAFAVSPSRELFLVFGNQVFFGSLP